MATPVTAMELLAGKLADVAVLSRDVADYYAGHGLVAELPLVLPCRMDSFVSFGKPRM